DHYEKGESEPESGFCVRTKYSFENRRHADHTQAKGTNKIDRQCHSDQGKPPAEAILHSNRLHRLRYVQPRLEFHYNVGFTFVLEKNWGNQGNCKSGGARSEFEQIRISIRNEINHSRHSQAAHDLGCSENFYFNQRNKEQRSEKQPRPVSLL